MFNGAESQKLSFLDKTKAAREERALEKKRDNAVVVIQSWIRGWLTRIKYEKRVLVELDNLLPKDTNDVTNDDIELKPCIDIYHASSRFLSLFKEKSSAYTERLEHLCRYLLASLESENPKFSYIGVALNKELSIAWIRHIKVLLYKCCVCIEKLKPDAPIDNEQNKTHEWESFNDFKRDSFNHYNTRLPVPIDKVTSINGDCDCENFYKLFVCQHLVGVAMRLKLIVPPEEAKTLQLGVKRKRGRPDLAKGPLHKQ